MKKLCLIAMLMLLFTTGHSQSIFSEGFNVTSVTNVMPTGWTLVTNGSTTGCNGTDWNQVPSGGFNCSINGTPLPRPTAESGTGMAGYNSWDISSGSTSDLITPSLDFSALGSYTLSFWVYNQQAFYGNDSLRVLINTSASSTGATLLADYVPNYNPPTTGWTQYTISIPTTFTSTSNYIIFRGVSNYGYDVFFDEVDVTHNPPVACTGLPLTPTISSAAIAAANPVCSGSTVTINAIDPNFPTTGGTSYQWETASSASGPWSAVTSGTGGNTRTYITPSMLSEAWFRMGVTCAASGQTAYTTTYDVPVGAPQPGPITGKVNFCLGDTATYSVTNVSGSTYAWTLPAADWSGTSTSNSILTTPGYTPGIISVTATTSCGTSIPQTITVNTGSAPGMPSTITGNNSVCANSSETYTISAVNGAVFYTWNVPAGWSTSGSATGTSITVTTGSTSGSVTVSAGNGCGSSVVSSLPVNVITSLANPAPISGNQTPCSGMLYSYSINPIAGAASYQWVLPSGWSGTTTGTSIQAFAGTSGGTISVTAYSPCATSPVASANIVVTPSVVPSVTVGTSSPSICEGTPVTFTAIPVNGGSAPGYLWKKNGMPMSATGATYTEYSLATGDIVSVILASSATCHTLDSVASAPKAVTVIPQVIPGISINATPVVSACAGTMLTFTTTATGTGAVPTYQWYNNGVAIGSATGTSYSSASLSNNDTISVALSTSAACASMPSVSSNKIGITINPAIIPVVAVSASSTVPIAGMPITFTATQSGGGSAPTYQWMLNGVNIPFETSNGYTSATLNPGDHVSVKMLSYDPCANPRQVTSADVVMNSPTGIQGLNTWDGAISLYPNPSNGRFTISASWNMAYAGKRVSIDVINVTGQVVFHSEVVPDRSTWHFDVQLSDAFASGTYALRLSSEDGMRAVAPFILSR